MRWIKISHSSSIKKTNNDPRTLSESIPMSNCQVSFKDRRLPLGISATCSDYTRCTNGLDLWVRIFTERRRRPLKSACNRCWTTQILVMDESSRQLLGWNSLGLHSIQVTSIILTKVTCITFWVAAPHRISMVSLLVNLDSSISLQTALTINLRNQWECSHQTIIRSSSISQMYPLMVIRSDLRKA